MSAIALSATRARQLQYPPQGLREDLLLLELDDQLLADVAKHGAVIKGDPNDTAVLCTADRTYAIKRVETTNTLLLVPPDGHRPQSAFPPTQQQQQTQQPTPTPTRTQQQQQPTQGTPLTTAAASALPPRPPSAADATPARDASALTPPGGLGLQTQLARAEEGAARSLPIVARAVARAHLEVAPTAPRLEVLERLLDERPYGLADEDDDEDDEDDDAGDEADGGDHHRAAVAAVHDPSPPPRAGVYTFARLLARVQASPVELRAALKELGAVRLGGGGGDGGDGDGGGGAGSAEAAAALAARSCCWRRADPSYLSSMLEMALATAAAEGWSLDALPLRAMQREMRGSGYRPRLVRHCLGLFGGRVAAAAPAPAAAAAPAPASATPAEEVVGSCPAAGTGGGSLRPTAPLPVTTGEQEVAYALDVRRVCLLFARRLLAPGGWGDGAEDPAAASASNSCHLGPPRDMARFLERWRADVRRAAGGSAALALRPLRAMLLGEALAEGDGGWWWGAEDGDEEEAAEKREGKGKGGEEGGEEGEEDGGAEDQEEAAQQQAPKRRRRADGDKAPAPLPLSRPPEGATLRLFPASALPPEPEARFAALFAARPRWLRRDLEPYLVHLTRAAAAAGGAGAATADALLLRHARASQRTPADPVTYSLR